MALLPNAGKAIIDPEKLYAYILSSTHPVGRFNAAFFRSYGYSADNWETFEMSLRHLILSCEAVEVTASQFGKKYLVEGPLSGTGTSIVNIITLWVILKGEDIPRFITAYPGELR